MRLYKIKQNQNTIAYLKDCISSKEFFNYHGGLCERVEHLTIEKLFNGVYNGTIAIFPVYENQDVNIILYHYKNNFDCYLMPYRDFIAMKKHYIDSLNL